MKKIILLGLSLISATSMFAQSITFDKTIKVIKSTPEYKTVTIRTPYQECWDEQVPVRYNNYNNNNIGALIGGIAGGILGHQVGGGSGKDAATVGGAIIGTLVGRNLSQNQNYSMQYQNQRRCVTKYEEKESEKFVGYKNIAYYKGKKLIKYSESPLRYIILHININY